MRFGKLSSRSCLAEGVECRGHDGHHGYTFGDEQLQKLRQVEARHEDECRAQDERRVQHHVQTIDMVEREEA